MRLESSWNVKKSSNLGVGILLGVMGFKIENFRGHNVEEGSIDNNCTTSRKYQNYARSKEINL